MDLDPPLLPYGCDVVEVLPDPVVADICPAADRQYGQELDLGVANRQRRVDVTRDEFSGEAQSNSGMIGDQRLEGTGCD
jgi:hypothetical protein